MITRVYGHEMRVKILGALSAVPEVQRVNYLEYWNAQTYLVFLEPNSEEVRTRVQAAVDSCNEGTWSVRLTFHSPNDPVPSSATLYQRSTGLLQTSP